MIYEQSAEIYFKMMVFLENIYHESELAFRKGCQTI